MGSEDRRATNHMLGLELTIHFYIATKIECLRLPSLETPHCAPFYFPFNFQLIFKSLNGINILH